MPQRSPSDTAGTLGNQYGGYGLTDAQARAANSGDASMQALWMCNYIKSTYGTPEAAAAHAYIESRKAFGRVLLIP